MKSTRTSRWLGLSAAVLACAVALSACTSGTTPSGSGAGGSTSGALTWGKAVEVVDLDPQTSYSAADGEILNRVYEPLVTVDNDLKPIPALATSWKRPSPTTYVFTLRKGVTWSNGRPLSVDDVVGSLERIIDPKTGSLSASFLPIASVKAVGSDQVEVNLRTPSNSFLAALAATASAILPIKELDSGTFDPKKELLGTGPYVSKSHVAGESWDLVSNKNYWGAKPKVSELRVKILTNDTARIAALRDGSIDFTSFSNPDAPTLLKGVSGVKAHVQPTADYYRADVNAISSPFSDPRLRQALALAIGRKEIGTTALGGTGTPVVAAAPPGLPVGCQEGQIPFAKPDLERAKKLVAEAGGASKQVTILAANSDAGYAAIAQVLQQQLTAVGFNVKIETLENGVWLNRVFTANPARFDLSISWFAGYADPGMVLGYWNPSASGFNKAWMPDNPALDKAIVESNEVTGDARKAALQTVCNMIGQGANMIPLATRSPVVAYRSGAVVPTFPKIEGYGDPFRYLDQFSK